MHARYSYDRTHKLRWSSEIFLSVIGPLAFAEETQKWVHEKISSAIPEGYARQVPSDVILYYHLQVERQLVFVSRKVQVAGLVETLNGTL